MNAVDTGEAVAVELERALPGAVERDVPLASLTTYHLGGPVSTLVRARSLDALAAVARVVREHAPPLLLVGRGSNLLVADHGFTGVAVVLAGDFERVDLDTDLDTDPGHGAGGRRGPAARARAPHRGGGAVGPRVLRRHPGQRRRRGPDERRGPRARDRRGARARHARSTWPVRATRWCTEPPTSTSGTASSALGAAEIVTSADFAVVAAPAEECERTIAEVVRWRREHQPGGANAGSVFRNPPGDSAGRIIDAAGLKGLRVGGAVVSPKHANFFQAEPGATADDVYRLMQEVRRRVGETSGITLEPELRLVGFGDTP